MRATSAKRIIIRAKRTTNGWGVDNKPRDEIGKSQNMSDDM